MGTFMGHVLPGSIFLILGLWTSYKLLEEYFILRRGAQLRNETTSYRNTLTHGMRSLGSFPIEETVIIILTSIGIIGEVATGFNGYLDFSIHNGQHISMYSMFGIFAIFHLLKHYRYPVPEGVEYAILSMCFVVEGLLFYHHLHQRKNVDVMIHMFIVYLCASTSVVTILEFKFRRAILPSLTRCYLVTVQGVWFIQAAFILYPPVGPSWNLEDHRQMMKVTIIYVWIFIGAIFNTLFLGVIANKKVANMTVNEIYEAVQYIKNRINFLEDHKLRDPPDDTAKYRAILSEEEEL